MWKYSSYSSGVEPGRAVDFATLDADPVSIRSSVKTSPAVRSRDLPQGRPWPRQGARNLLDACVLFRRQLVQILVDRLRRFDVVQDAVQTCHQLCGECEEWVAGRIRSAELDALLQPGRCRPAEYGWRRNGCVRSTQIDRRCRRW